MSYIIACAAALRTRAACALIRVSAHVAAISSFPSGISKVVSSQLEETIADAAKLSETVPVYRSVIRFNDVASCPAFDALASPWTKTRHVSVRVGIRGGFAGSIDHISAPDALASGEPAVVFFNAMSKARYSIAVTSIQLRTPIISSQR